MRLERIALVLMISAVAALISNAQEPVTPNASPEARALLKYLYGLSGKHILAGQHNFPNSG